jgi:competence protein ComEC
VIGTLEERITEKKDKYLSLRIETIRRLGVSSGLPVLMARVRAGVISRLLAWLPGDEGGLAAGILVGGDEVMSDTGVKAFRSAGLAHVVAASGYNVAVVASGTLTLLTVILGRGLGMWFVLLFIILYVFVAGGSASVIRAGIMAILVVIGQIWGRKTDGLWILGISSLLMLLVKPEWFGDIGFQLSVAATGGIILTGGKNLVKQTLAAYLATLPLVLHYFGNLSIVAPLTNVLLIWPVPIVTPVLAAAVILGSAWPAGGGLMALLSWPALRLMTGGAEYFSQFYWSSVTINPMGWWWVAGYYGMMIGGLIIVKRKCRQLNG